MITPRAQILIVMSLFGRCLFDKQAKRLKYGKLMVYTCFSSYFPLQKPPGWNHKVTMVGRDKLLKEPEVTDDLKVIRKSKLSE